MSRKYLLPLILLVVAAIYAPALRHDFVYDDHGAIVENTFLDHSSNVRSVLSLQTLGDSRVLDGQRPVLLLTHFAERAIWGIKPFGYHLTNLLLHLLVVSLVFALARRWGARAAAVALLLGLHPVLSEAVVVPSFREDLLVSVFGLLYLLASSRPLLSLLFLGLGLLSKESAAVFPVLLAWLWMCHPASRPARSRQAALLLGSFAVIGAYFVVLHASRGLQASTGIWNGYALQFPENLFTAPWLFVEHLKILILPLPLCADRIIEPVAALTNWRFGAGLAAMAVTAGLALAMRKSVPVAAFGLGWLLIAFVPISNVIPLYNPMAERYLYFTAIGLALFLSTAFSRPTAIVACLLYAVLTFERVPDWRNDYTLWMKTGQQAPESARAHTWSGLELKSRGHVEVAARHFRDAERINPHDVSALINLAIMDGERGDLAAAEEKLREAIRRRPDKRLAYENLAVALEFQGRLLEAEAARSEAENL